MPKNRNRNREFTPIAEVNYTITDVVNEIRDVKNVLYTLLNRLEAVLRVIGREHGAPQKTPTEES